MRSVVLVAGVLMLTITGVAAAASRADQVARGSYLVNHVAMCVQCHTPRDANGEARSDAPAQRRAGPRPVAVPHPAVGGRAPRHRRPAGVFRRGRDHPPYHRTPARQRRAEAAHATVPAHPRGRRGRGRLSAVAAVRRARGGSGVSRRCATPCGHE